MLDGVLTPTYNPNLLTKITIIKNRTFVSYIDWDPDHNTPVIIADERHGMNMAGDTHAYLHVNFGARYSGGNSFSAGNVNGTGDNALDAQVSNDTGKMTDEDVIHTIPAYALGDTYPVLFLIGPVGAVKMRRLEHVGFPMITGQDAVAAGYTVENYNANKVKLVSNFLDTDNV